MDTLKVHYLQSHGRTFVIPDEDDLEYNKQVYSAKVEDLRKNLEMEEAREGTENFNPTRIEDMKGEVALLEQFVEASTKALTKRKEMLQRSDCKIIEVEWSEPAWGLVSEANSKFRTYDATQGRYITDNYAVNCYLLAKCAPGVAKLHPAIADHLITKVRRATEVNIADLPFI
jgi:hypothetical protein